MEYKNTGIQEYRALHWLLGLPLCLYPGAECSEVQWYSATVLQCYRGTVVLRYCGTVVQWYSATVVLCYRGTVLQGYSATYIGTVLLGAVLQVTGVQCYRNKIVWSSSEVLEAYKNWYGG